MLAKPLLKEAAIGSIILENPFYGKRKPNDQVLVYYFIHMYDYILVDNTSKLNMIVFQINIYFAFTILMFFFFYCMIFT